MLKFLQWLLGKPEKIIPKPEKKVNSQFQQKRLDRLKMHSHVEVKPKLKLNKPGSKVIRTIK